jgi:hypothetical protein
VTLQAGPLRRVVGQRRFDDAAPLVACRTEDFLEQRVGDAVRVVVGIDHDQVHGPDEATRPDGRSQREDRASDHLAPGLGDEDARLGEVDQLSEQVSRVQRAARRGAPDGAAAERDDPFDVRDASGPDQVFHAGGGTSCGRPE